MITYNHEKFLNQAIDSILMQQTSFPVELVIGEDFSLDGTRSICMQYKEQYPEKIRLLLHETNIGMSENFISTLKNCKGKYIAFCEGDDYWSDSSKLQKQVDFLEEHSKYSVCFHRYDIFDEVNNVRRSDQCAFLFTDLSQEYATVDMHTFLNNWVTQPVTMLFRNDVFDCKILNQYKYTRDMHLIFHLLEAGKCAILSFNGAVYREHAGGIHGKQTLKHQVEIGTAVAKELYQYNRVIELKKNYLNTLDWGISCSKSEKWPLGQRFSYIKEYLLVSRNFKKMIKHILNVC